MSSSAGCNPTPNLFVRGWFERGDRMTAPPRPADASCDRDKGSREGAEASSGARNNKKCVHVPHGEKPPQVVARRNARERRRVQAVNCAFGELRKAIPLDNNRGKRVSKVKTLKYAIRYIHELKELLNEDLPYAMDMYNYASDNTFDEYDYEDDY